MDSDQTCNQDVVIPDPEIVVIAEDGRVLLHQSLLSFVPEHLWFYSPRVFINGIRVATQPGEANSTLGVS